MIGQVQAVFAAKHQQQTKTHFLTLNWKLLIILCPCCFVYYILHIIIQYVYRSEDYVGGSVINGRCQRQ